MRSLSGRPDRPARVDGHPPGTGPFDRKDVRQDIRTVGGSATPDSHPSIGGAAGRPVAGPSDRDGSAAATASRLRRRDFLTSRLTVHDSCSRTAVRKRCASRTGKRKGQAPEARCRMIRTLTESDSATRGIPRASRPRGPRASRIGLTAFGSHRPSPHRSANGCAVGGRPAVHKGPAGNLPAGNQRPRRDLSASPVGKAPAATPFGRPCCSAGQRWSPCPRSALSPERPVARRQASGRRPARHSHDRAGSEGGFHAP